MRTPQDTLFLSVILSCALTAGCGKTDVAPETRRIDRPAQEGGQVRVTDELDPSSLVALNIIAARVYADFPDTAALRAKIVRYRDAQVLPESELTVFREPIGPQEEFQVIYDDSGEQTVFSVAGVSLAISRMEGDDRFHGRAVWRPEAVPLRTDEYIPVLGVLKSAGDSIESAALDATMEQLSKEYPFAEFICIRAESRE